MAMQWSRFNRNIKQSLVKMAESTRSRPQMTSPTDEPSKNKTKSKNKGKSKEHKEHNELVFTPRLRVKGVNDLTKINKVNKPE